MPISPTMPSTTSVQKVIRQRIDGERQTEAQ